MMLIKRKRKARSNKESLQSFKKLGYKVVVDSSGETKSLVGPSGRLYQGSSLGYFSLYSPFRRAFIRINESKTLERAVLATIFFNCVFLSIQGPPGGASAFYNTDGGIELAFTVIFTLEMLCRIFAMGFVRGPSTYLRNGWNQLDFTVVLMGWLPYLFPWLNNLSAIRSVRALRPLRTINRMPMMKKQVSTLLDSLPKMSDVAALSGFMLLLFGVLGIQMFKCTLLYRCYEEGSEEPIDVDTGVCGDRGVPGGRGSCGEGQVCRFYGHNPMHGTNGFDNIAQARTAWLHGMASAAHSHVPPTATCRPQPRAASACASSAESALHLRYRLGRRYTHLVPA